MKGNCYQDALNAQRADPRLTLCHGWPTLTVPPFAVYGHAWCEYEGGAMVLDAAANMRLPRVLYYRVGQIDEARVRRYTAAEADALLLKKWRYGPWTRAPKGAMFAPEAAS